MSKCALCPSKRGKLISLGCECVAHKRCAYTKVLSNLKFSVLECPVCKKILAPPPAYVLINALRDHINDWPFTLSRKGLVPVIYYRDSSEIRPLDVESQQWSQYCKLKATEVPYWARFTLLRASKNCVVYRHSGSRWE